MGLFDSVHVPCPKCGKPVEFQSKADEEPCMNRFTIDDAPTHILTDVLNDPTYHGACGQWVALVDDAFPPNATPPRPSPRIVKLRPPDKFHSHQQGIRWWDQEFSFADIDTAPPAPRERSETGTEEKR